MRLFSLCVASVSKMPICTASRSSRSRSSKCIVSIKRNEVEAADTNRNPLDRVMPKSKTARHRCRTGAHGSELEQGFCVSSQHFLPVRWREPETFDPVGARLVRCEGPIDREHDAVDAHLGNAACERS